MLRVPVLSGISGGAAPDQNGMKRPIQANGMDLRALYRSTVLYDLRAALRAADPEPAPVFMNESEGILYTDERISSMRNRASWTRRDEASTTAFLVADRRFQRRLQR